MRCCREEVWRGWHKPLFLRPFPRVQCSAEVQGRVHAPAVTREMAAGCEIQMLQRTALQLGRGGGAGGARCCESRMRLGQDDLPLVPRMDVRRRAERGRQMECGWAAVATGGAPGAGCWTRAGSRWVGRGVECGASAVQERAVAVAVVRLRAERTRLLGRGRHNTRGTHACSAGSSVAGRAAARGTDSRQRCAEAGDAREVQCCGSCAASSGSKVGGK